MSSSNYIVIQNVHVCLNDINLLENYKRSFYLVSVNHEASKGYFHLCPRMDFLQTLHINNSLYTNYENVFIELDS